MKKVIVGFMPGKKTKKRQYRKFLHNGEVVFIPWHYSEYVDKQFNKRKSCQKSN